MGFKAMGTELRGQSAGQCHRIIHPVRQKKRKKCKKFLEAVPRLCLRENTNSRALAIVTNGQHFVIYGQF